MRANFIPIKIRQQRAYQKRVRKIMFFLKGIAGILLFAMVFQGSMAYYFQNNRDADVPQNIKAEYSKALQGSELLKQKESLLLKAQKEDQAAVQIIGMLTVMKPADIRLTRLEATDANIQLEGFSNDAASFNRYVAEINQTQATFNKAVVEKIATGTGDYKTFQIKTQRVQ